ncbi:hypothetical protein ACLBWZ_12850 [Brucellaceae bacterium C25G]
MTNCDMENTEKYFVLPYRKNGRSLQAAEMCPTQSAESAARIAGLMAERFAGVIVHAVTVYEETGNMNDPRILTRHDDVPAPQED